MMEVPSGSGDPSLPRPVCAHCDRVTRDGEELSALPEGGHLIHVCRICYLLETFQVLYVQAEGSLEGNDRETVSVALAELVGFLRGIVLAAQRRDNDAA